MSALIKSIEIKVGATLLRITLEEAQALQAQLNEVLKSHEPIPCCWPWPGPPQIPLKSATVLPSQIPGLTW